MTTEVPEPTPVRRRRPRQAAAGRALDTVLALSATGALVAVMGLESPVASGAPVAQPAATAPIVEPAAAPPTIVVIHRRFSTPDSGAAPAAASPASAPATAPAVGRPTPAPRPVAPPPPVATTTGS